MKDRWIGDWRQRARITFCLTTKELHLYVETRDDKAERAKWSHIDPSIPDTCTVQAIMAYCEHFYANNNCSFSALWSRTCRIQPTPEAVMAMTNSAF